MTVRTFSPGFRLSWMDVAILVAGGAAATGVGAVDGWMGLAIAFVVGHFFLFCNVLRMSRPPELVWAVTFAVWAAASGYGVASWPMVFTVCAALTMVLAINEMRRPWYHGVGWQRLNPRLPQWWEAETARVGAV